MTTKCINVVVVKSDKHSAVTHPIFRPWLSLIQDQLKSEQVDFKYECPALFVILPLQREAAFQSNPGTDD